MGIPTGDSTVPRYQLQGGNMPEPVRQRITQKLKSVNGRDPTEAELLSAYRLDPTGGR